MAWFCSISATFAASRVTKPITQFGWALSKLPAWLIDTIGSLCDYPSSVKDPYKELLRIVLRSYGICEHQKIVKWLDHPSLGANKPSVLMDQVNALQPSSIVQVQKICSCARCPPTSA
jgi:hypothetical protein